MRHILIILIILVCQNIQAQDSTEENEPAKTFTRSYPLFQFSEDGAESWQEIKEGQTLFVFNKGADEHIEWITNGSKDKIYKTSDVSRDSTDAGNFYQGFEAITENGLEVLFFLFDSGILLLYFPENDDAIRFINPDYLKE